MLKLFLFIVLSLTFICNSFAGDCDIDFGPINAATAACGVYEHSCETTGWSPEKVIPANETTETTKVIGVSCVRTRCNDGFMMIVGGGSVSIPISCGGDLSPSNDGEKQQCSSKKSGSIISAQERTVGEIIPLARSSFDLVYSSERVPGNVAAYTYSANLTGEVALPGLSGVGVNVKNEVGTTVYTKTSGVSANDMFNYTWNGLDHLGNSTWGPLIYNITFSTAVSPGGVFFDFNEVSIGSVKIKRLGLGGWAPSIWRFYSNATGTLFRGDGSIAKLESESIGGGIDRVVEADGSLIYDFVNGLISVIRTPITGAAIYTFAYSGDKLSTITEPHGLVTTFNYSGGNLQSITNPYGQTTTISLDTNGFISGVTSPSSAAYTMTYSAGGLLLTFTKPNGAVSTFTYETDGRLKKDAHSGGFYATVAEEPYNYYQRRYSYSTKMARKTVYAGDGRNRARVITHPSGRTETFSFNDTDTNDSSFGQTFARQYEPDARLGGSARFMMLQSLSYGSVNSSISRSQTFSLNDPDDPFSIDSLIVTSTRGTDIVSTTYSGATNEYVTTTAVGNTFAQKIDSYERPIEFQIGSLTKSELTYTGRQLTKVKQGARETNISYDSLTGLISTLTNALGQVTSYAYDSADRLTAITLPDLRVISYSYDSIGRLLSITPASRPAHSFVYNPSELPSEYVPPSLSGVSVVKTTYAYNNDNQLTTITRPTGATVGFTYNSTTGLLTGINLSAESYTVTNDAQDRIAEMESANFSSGRSYAGGSIISQETFTRKLPSSLIWGNFERTFNSAYGDVNQEVVSGATGTNTISYLYNDDRTITKAGNMTLNYSTPSNLLVSTDFGNSDDSYGYNAFGEVTSYGSTYSGSNIYSLSFVRDLMGRITEKTESSNGVTNIFEYTYDLSGRLTQVKKNGSVVSTYAYDNNNNRTGGIVYGTSTSATYDDQDRMTAYNTYSFTYNANGDLLTKTNTLTSQVTSYNYDARGGLRSVTLPGGSVVSYEIDGYGRRIGRKVGSTVSRRYIYNGQLQIVGEVDSAGALKRRYVYGTNKNTPDFFLESGVEYRIISDHLGSPRIVVRKSNGAIMQRIEHDEFGRVVSDTNPGYTPFGFAGGLYDSSTGLLRFGARDYDPETGRWLSKDPILFGGGDTNLYGYVMQDPVNWVDPTGLKIKAGPGVRISDTVRNSEIYKKLDRGPDIQINIKPLPRQINGETPDAGHIFYSPENIAFNQKHAGWDSEDDTLIHELIHAESWLERGTTQGDHDGMNDKIKRRKCP